MSDDELEFHTIAPQRTRQIDPDKVNTLEDVIALITGLNIYFNGESEHWEAIAHLLKEVESD